MSKDSPHAHGLSVPFVLLVNAVYIKILLLHTSTVVLVGYELICCLGENVL